MADPPGYSDNNSNALQAALDEHLAALQQQQGEQNAQQQQQQQQQQSRVTAAPVTRTSSSNNNSYTNNATNIFATLLLRQQQQQQQQQAQQQQAAQQQQPPAVAAASHAGLLRALQQHAANNGAPASTTATAPGACPPAAPNVAGQPPVQQQQQPRPVNINLFAVPAPNAQHQQQDLQSIGNAIAAALQRPPAPAPPPQPAPAPQAPAQQQSIENAIAAALQRPPAHAAPPQPAPAPQAPAQQQSIENAIAAALQRPPAPSQAPASTALHSALASVLQASSTAEMAMSTRNQVGQLAILQALTQGQQQPPPAPAPAPVPVPPPPAPASSGSQDALAQLLANPAGFAEALGTLLGGGTANTTAIATAITSAAMRQQQQQQGATAAAAAPPMAAAAAAPVVAAAAPATVEIKVVKKAEPKEDEEIPIPDLPKIRPLPPLEEGETPHFDKRTCVPLAIEEDSNWLSERQCFIRAELLEVVRASHQDVLVRSSSKSVAYQQVGIRCKYCAHLHPSSRAIRSSAFPSSIRQMYQSFTMMVRDHWAGCSAVPPHLKKRFTSYQEHKIPSSNLSRGYWAYAAAKIGMINTEYGITITKDSLDGAEKMDSFGTTPEHIAAMLEKERKGEPLVHPSDRAAVSPYLYELMSQVEICHLLPSERVGKRKDAPVGLSGFGCKHCIAVGRLGFCRVFPLNKRSLPTKVNDIYCHFQRCPLTPAETRRSLRKLKHANTLSNPKSGKADAARFAERDREFVDQIWSKLGRKGAQIGGPGR